MAAMWSPMIGLLLLLLLLEPSSSAATAINLPLEVNVYPDGHYYVTLDIGKPPKPYFLDIDTGSNLTWLECNRPDYGCQHCSQALHKDLPGSNPLGCNKKPHPCHYKIQYVDGSSEGVLSIDRITIRKEVDKHIALGCGYNQQPQTESGQSPVDGILGLGMGTVGFVPQLKLQKMIAKNIIGHCLSKDEGGYLFFGDNEQIPSHGITWARMRKYE